MAPRSSKVAPSGMSEAYAVEVAAREDDRYRAARVVAGRSNDVEDCRELLGMLGLDLPSGPSIGPSALH